MLNLVVLLYERYPQLLSTCPLAFLPALAEAEVAVEVEAVVVQVWAEEAKAIPRREK